MNEPHFLQNQSENPHSASSELPPKVRHKTFRVQFIYEKDKHRETQLGALIYHLSIVTVLLSFRRTIPLKVSPEASLKPLILPVFPFWVKASTCFWVSFFPWISIGIRKSHDFPYCVHPQAVLPWTISPWPHFGHFNGVVS